MRLEDLHPFHQEQWRFLREKGQEDSLWFEEAARLASVTEFPDADAALGALLRAQRLSKIFRAGLQSNEAFKSACGLLRPKAWDDFSSPPVEEALLERLAGALYNVQSPERDIASLLVADGARRVGVLLFERLLKEKVPTLVSVMDPAFGTLLLNFAEEEGIHALAQDFLAMMMGVNKRIIAAAGDDDAFDIEPDLAKSRLYRELTQSFSKRISSGEVFYTLTEVPTEATARKDGMAFDDYIKLFFELCDQPWEKIEAAQSILIQELNPAKELRIVNDDGTDVVFDIDGFTFCNSVIAKNVPGSEVFSAPNRCGVDGKIVSIGKFAAPHDPRQIIEDMTLVFKQGELVEWKAREGQKALDEAIGTDEGMRHLGEVALGTNPHLRRHVINGLLVEKVGGSFHVALGNAYTYTEYVGVPVKVDNGNRSKIHWDVTTLLRGKGGKIWVDGREIMRDGMFLDPAYEVFNRGWASVPREERPDYWKDYAFLD